MHPIDKLALIRAEIIAQRTALVAVKPPNAAAARPTPEAKPVRPLHPAPDRHSTADRVRD